MPFASVDDFRGLANSEKVDGTKLPKTGPGGIYHEKQIGALCAMHAVNNLLQGPICDEMKLRVVAGELDAEERKILGDEVMDHGNARLDGFFNVQVISVTLERMGFTVEPLRGEAGKTALKDSAKEAGYICNRREHWFALRRIGNEWFDLNSCMLNPRHHNASDMHHIINEALREGYDVLVVRGPYEPSPLEDNPEAMLECIKGCGRHDQGYSLFVGSGNSMGGSAISSPEDMKAARLARLMGGSPPPSTSPGGRAENPPAESVSAAPSASAASSTGSHASATTATEPLPSLSPSVARTVSDPPVARTPPQQRTPIQPMKQAAAPPLQDTPLVPLHQPGEERQLEVSSPKKSKMFGCCKSLLRTFTGGVLGETEAPLLDQPSEDEVQQYLQELRQMNAFDHNAH